MRTKREHYTALVFLTLLPGIVYAQHVPGIIVLAVLSPLAVITLAVVLGFLVRSWKTGLTHVGLMIIWLVLFVFAAQSVENDYVIWTPLALYCIHALIVLALVIGKVGKRIAARSLRNRDNKS